MGVFVNAGWVAQVLRWLPKPLLAPLDAWSARLARRRAQARRERLVRQRAARTAS